MGILSKMKKGKKKKEPEPEPEVEEEEVEEKPKKKGRKKKRTWQDDVIDENPQMQRTTLKPEDEEKPKKSKSKSKPDDKGVALNIAFYVVAQETMLATLLQDDENFAQVMADFREDWDLVNMVDLTGMSYDEIWRSVGDKVLGWMHHNGIIEEE